MAASRRFEHQGGWRGDVYVERRRYTELLTCRVELFRRGQPICRILQARHYESEHAAIEAVIATALHWIDTWNQRAAAGKVADGS